MRMKDKQREQIENKRRHKEGLRGRRNEPNLNRPAPSRQERPVILIVCEGENTEKSYFDQFRLTSARLVTLGKGFNTMSLVNEAIRLNALGNYERVWCVFDKDDFAAQDFNNAINIGRAQGFGVAYSNQAFEYWLLLHFNDHQGGAMSRADYNTAINEHTQTLGVTYDGNGTKIVTPALFELLEGVDRQTDRVRRDLAIQRASRIHNSKGHHSPATEESSTTVYELVKEIMMYTG